MFKFKILRSIFVLFLLLLDYSAQAHITNVLILKKAYPEQIVAVSSHDITWADGSKMLVGDEKKYKTEADKLNHPSLIDQISDVKYFKGIPSIPFLYNPQGDPGRIRFEPFFLKMYGNSSSEVIKHLTTIYWMPKYFGHKYPLLVTTINHIDKKFERISRDLEQLVTRHPEYLPYLDEPGGTFGWREIAKTHRISLHSFGMTIDINANHSNYWQWDLERSGVVVAEDTSPLPYRNDIPWEIIPIFEKYGFIWGGKWKHYDSMHFEYRPELLME